MKNRYRIVFVILFLGLLGISNLFSADKSRGLWASLTTDEKSVFVSWRMRSTDAPKSTTYKLYADGNLVATLNDRTNVKLSKSYQNSVFSLEVLDKEGNLIDSQEKVSCQPHFFLNLKLDVPANYRMSDGTEVTYSPNDASAYDMDGDGEQEIILKWEPSNAGATCTATGPQIVDCYKLNGQRLWRIDFGPNVLAGCRFTFLCYDFDGDGKGELIAKTAQGSKDASGNFLSKGVAKGANHYASSITNGVITDGGKEWITCFDGTTGRELATIDYWPYFNAHSEWNPGGNSDGNRYGHRGNWFKGCVAFLDVDGKAKPCAVTTRGIYTYSYAAAYSWDGENLSTVWRHSSTQAGQGIYGEGAHSITCGDVDDDGFDEIFVGAAALDHDGSLLWRSGLGHGDATHLGDFDPDNPGMEYFIVMEHTDVAYDCALFDARTGRVLSSQRQTGGDTGRGLILNCDSAYAGAEYMEISSENLFDCKGNAIGLWHNGSNNSSSINYRIFWDGDLLEEYHDRSHVDKWNSGSWGRTMTFYSYSYGANTNNATKYNPCLQADLVGDWREEVVFWGTDANGAVYLIMYTSTMDSPYKLPWLRDDHTYDMAVAWQNCGYNQPPHLGYDPFEYYKQLSLTATLTKNGAGPSVQEVKRNSPIVDFAYTWENATTVVVEGLPEGVTYQIDGSARKVYISGTPVAEPGVYPFSVTTVGNEPDAQKSGKIIVLFDEPAEIIKYGDGDSEQEVEQDSAIVPFGFEWKNAETVEVQGLPNGIVAKIDNEQKRVEFSGVAKDSVGVYSYRVQTVGGMTDSVWVGSFKIVAQISTGLTWLDVQKGVEVTPNPMSGYSRVQVDETLLDDEVKCMLIDMRGRVVWNANVKLEADHSFVIKRGDWQQGAYILKVISSSEVSVIRLLVE